MLSSEGPTLTKMALCCRQTACKAVAMSEFPCFCAGAAQQPGWLLAAAQAAGRPEPALCFRAEGGPGGCSQRGVHHSYSLHIAVSHILHCISQGSIDWLLEYIHMQAGVLERLSVGFRCR
jgi:hypothetical protein